MVKKPVCVDPQVTHFEGLLIHRNRDAFQVAHRRRNCQILTAKKLMIQLRRVLHINSKYMSALGFAHLKIVNRNF